jgi:Na+-translocating ferredoxin:NAD+ oxidoreductase RnfG subunit
MGILDAFKKKKDSEKNSNPMDPQNMGFIQKMAMKKLQKMSPEEREKLMQQVMTPDNIQKNKADIMKYLDQMEKSGQMNKHQIFEAKKRLGLL